MNRSPSSAKTRGGDYDDNKCLEVWGGNANTNSHFRRPGLDVWVWSQSHQLSHAGGGDLHLFSSCASGRITRMLLADICGCSSLFGDIAGSLRELMIRNVNSIQQTRLVRTMSHRLEDSSRHGGCASALVTTFFAPTRSFSLCNAGHPPPLLFRAQSNEWSVLKQSSQRAVPSNVPLGVTDPHDYQQLTTHLALGDLVLSYSNVFTECLGTNGRILGIEGLMELVRELDARRPSELTTNLVARIRRLHSDNLAGNDATLLLCCATETPVSWQDNLLAPFRLLRRASDNTKIR